MYIHKELSKNNELYLYMNGELIYKRWLNTGQSKVFDVMAYGKYTHSSYTDLDVKDSDYLIHLSAKVRFLTTKEGGRVSGVYSGYRPNHVFELSNNEYTSETFMGEINFDHHEVLELGQEYSVRIKFPLVQRIERFMEINRQWWIYEGAQQVGEARIIDFQMPLKSY